MTKRRNVNVNRDVIKDFSTKFKFGINKTSIKKVNNLEELKENPPGLITAKVLKNFYMNQNGHKKELKKGNTYIMSLISFNNLWVDKTSKTKLLKPGNSKFINMYKPYSGQDLNNKSVLFMRHGGIGDLLFCNVLLQHIKEKYPSCKIGFATGISYQKMIKDWPELVDDLIELPLTIQKFNSYDYHIIFEGVIERNEEAHKLNAYKLFSKWLNLDIPDEKLIPRQTPNKSQLIYINDYLNSINLKEKEYIVLQPDASSIVRTPSDDFWIKVINKFTENNYKIIITNSKHKKQRMDDLISKCDNKENIFNFANDIHELDSMIALISKSLMVISTDSASLHIAASLDIPLFGIYGPFKGEIRLSTYKNADWINSNKECSPCFIHSYNPCKNSNKLGNPLCFENINIDEIYERSIKLIKNRNI